jgi:hypothetical protein
MSERILSFLKRHRDESWTWAFVIALCVVINQFGYVWGFVFIGAMMLAYVIGGIASAFHSAWKYGLTLSYFWQRWRNRNST